MSSNKILYGLSVAAVALVASTASAVAVPITFKLNGGTGDQAQAFTFTKPDTTLKLTVKSNTANESGSTVTPEGKVGKWSEGLGIVDGQTGDAHFVDGNGRNDVLSFAFSQNVRLLSVGFSYVDHNDDFAFFFDKGKDGVLQNDLVWKTKDIPGNGFYGTFSFAYLTNNIGKLFGIGAYGSNDDFKVASITVDFVKPSTVPLPGALPLFVAGLAGLGWMRRRGSVKTLA
jgi:hypothetical protein